MINRIKLYCRLFVVLLMALFPSNCVNTNNQNNETERIIELLQKSEKEDVRARAAKYLNKCKSNKVVSVLQNALFDSSDPVRCESALSLGEAGDLSSIELLIIAMKKYEEEQTLARVWNYSACIYAYCYALEKLSGNKFGLNTNKWYEWWDDNFHLYSVSSERENIKKMEENLALIKSDFPSEKSKAIAYLGNLRSNQFVNILMQILLNDSDNFARSWAAWGLGEIKDGVDIDSLVQIKKQILQKECISVDGEYALLLNIKIALKKIQNGQ